MGCSVGGRLVGRPLGDAEPSVANEKAAMQRNSTGLNLFTAIAQDGIWTLLEKDKGWCEGEIFSNTREESDYMQVLISTSLQSCNIGNER